MINNPNNACPSGGYQDYTSSTAPNMTATLVMGSTYTGNVTTNYTWGNESVKVWIDFNQNGTFEASEVVATLDNISSTSVGSISVSIPFTALPGVTRMRIRLVYTSTASGIDPCNSVTWGECHDYKVTIIPPAPPDNAGVGSLSTPDATPFCSNSFQQVSVNVVNYGANALNSATVNWSVDGVLQSPVSFTTTLPYYMDSATVVLGTVLFPTTAPVEIKAWTTMPNGVPDSDNSDDTLNVSPAAVLQGVDVNIIPQDTTICQGNSITLDAGTHPDNPIYIWSNGTINQTIDVSEPGSYSVKVQNNMGCFDRDTVYVSVHPNPVINSIAIIDNSGGSFTFNVIGANNVDSFEWNFDDGTIIKGAGLPGQQIHSFTQGGLYNVTLRIWNMCNEITTTRLVEVQGPTGIGSLSGLQKEIRLFPNPTKNKVTISSGSNLTMKTVGIFNLVGQNIYKNEQVNAGKLDVDVTAFASGIYNVIIETDKGKITKKLEVIQ